LKNRNFDRIVNNESFNYSKLVIITMTIKVCIDNDTDCQKSEFEATTFEAKAEDQNGLRL